MIVQVERLATADVRRLGAAQAVQREQHYAQYTFRPMLNTHSRQLAEVKAMSFDLDLDSQPCTHGGRIAYCIMNLAKSGQHMLIQRDLAHRTTSCDYLCNPTAKIICTGPFTRRIGNTCSSNGYKAAAGGEDGGGSHARVYILSSDPASSCA